jgi:hypothetical protein
MLFLFCLDKLYAIWYSFQIISNRTLLSYKKQYLVKETTGQNTLCVLLKL